MKIDIKKNLLTGAVLCMAACSYGQDSIPVAKVPFEGMNLGWINGQNRNTDPSLLQLHDKSGETILTGTVLVDGYFNYSFARPKDNTQTISASMGRTNEFQLNQVSIGVEAITGTPLADSGCKPAL